MAKQPEYPVMVPYNELCELLQTAQLVQEYKDEVARYREQVLALRIMQLLGLKDVPWQKMEKGRNGYKCRYFFENISILYDGAENMGVCVDMSGTGCRAFETYSTINWNELMEILLPWMILVR